MTPGAEYEGRVGPRTTLGLGAYYLGYPISLPYVNFYTIDGQLRHYYNIAKRSRQGKRYRNNSGEFVMLNVFGGEYQEINFNTGDEEGTLLGGGAAWGFQRTYGSGIYLSGVLGVVIYTVGSEEAIRPAYKFKLGYAFGSRYRFIPKYY